MLTLLLCLVHVVVCSTAQRCTITPVNPPDLTDGILNDGTPNVTIDCSCSHNEGIAITKVKWFFPDGSRARSITKTSPGSPYVATSNSDTVSTLIIPVFDDTYKGNYTCKPRDELENNSPMSTIQLLLGEYGSV